MLPAAAFLLFLFFFLLFLDLLIITMYASIHYSTLPDELYGPVSQQEPHGSHDDNDGWLLLLHTLQYSSQDDFPAQSADSNWLTRQHGMGGRTTGLCVGGGFDGTAFCSRYHISNILGIRSPRTIFKDICNKMY